MKAIAVVVFVDAAAVIVIIVSVLVLVLVIDILLFLLLFNTECPNFCAKVQQNCIRTNNPFLYTSCRCNLRAKL